MSFHDYARAGFTSELLPILPPDAVVNPASPQRENLEKSRGKVPGRQAPGGWFGFGQWTSHHASDSDVDAWTQWKAGVGLQGRRFPALDVDVEEGEIADAIETSALFDLGLAPARFGRGSRRLLVYAGAGLSKRRLAFRLGRRPEGPAAQLGSDAGGGARPDGQDPLDLAEGPGGARARAGEEADPRPLHAVELLGDGQQYVVEGIHPKTGKPYYWRENESPAGLGAENLTPVSAEELDAFFESLAWALENIYDAEIVDLARGSPGRDAGVWQDGLLAPSADALERALGAIENTLAYDDWFSVMVAVKAAAGGSEDGFTLFADWSASSGKDVPEVTRDKWASIRPPYRIGWQWLAAKAQEASGGQFNAADEEFEAAEPTGQGDGRPDLPYEETLLDSTRNMFKRYAWIEGAKRAVHLESGVLLDQEQFEFRIPPTDKGSSPWKLFKESPIRRQSFVNLTFRPGAGRIVEEDLPDLSGPCFNVWRAPKMRRPLPDKVTAEEIEPFLDLAAHVVPIAEERAHVLDWMAFTAQQPGQKINHALVLGSRVEGIGKDTLFEPLRQAIGRTYTREIGPQHLSAQFNAWALGAKLVIVQEMHNFERKETMNRLKPLVAAPPEALAVNMKHRQEFFVPNLMNTVFFTNELDALALSRGDRRYFVSWNDGEPLPKDAYERVWAWLQAGGSEKVVRWLMSRDVSKFEPKGRAPATEAKEMMREQSRPPLQEWVEEGIAAGEAPFDRDLVLVEDILAAVPEHARYKGQRPSATRVGRILRELGAAQVTDKVWVDKETGSRRIWALRRKEMYAGLEPKAVAALLLEQKREVTEQGLRSVDSII